MLSDAAEHSFHGGINEYAGYDLGCNEARLRPWDEEIIDSGFNIGH